MTCQKVLVWKENQASLFKKTIDTHSSTAPKINSFIWMLASKSMCLLRTCVGKQSCQSKFGGHRWQGLANYTMAHWRHTQGCAHYREKRRLGKLVEYLFNILLTWQTSHNKIDMLIILQNVKFDKALHILYWTCCLNSSYLDLPVPSI